MPEKRWKAVERFIAAELNQVLSDVGKFTPIERIPLLGREGPDLTVNETGLVINVKSRQVIPPYLYPSAKQFLTCGKLVIFRLKDLARLDECFANASADRWKQLFDWYDRMDQWTKQFCQSSGISAIILHRPRMPYGNSGIAIHYENLRRLSCNLKTNLSR